MRTRDGVVGNMGGTHWSVPCRIAVSCLCQSYLCQYQCSVLSMFEFAPDFACMICYYSPFNFCIGQP